MDLNGVFNAISVIWLPWVPVLFPVATCLFFYVRSLFGNTRSLMLGLVTQENGPLGTGTQMA